MGNKHGKEINHDDHDGEYAKFSRITQREVHFRVRAERTTTVALTSAVTDDLYELHFGSDDNTHCVISRNGGKVASCDTPDILNGDEPRGFWIRWKPRPGRLLVGREGERNPFMLYRVDPLLPISRYAIRVEAGGRGRGNFSDEDEYSTSSSFSSDDDEDEDEFSTSSSFSSDDATHRRGDNHKQLVVPIRPASDRSPPSAEPPLRIPGRWKWARDGHVLSHGVASGEGNECVEYVGWCYVDGTLWIGRKGGHCGEKEAIDTYQALVKTNEGLEWVDAIDGGVPRGALLVRNDYGDSLFVARAEHDDIWCCGHLKRVPHPVYIPLGGEEHQHHQYQVLCATTINLR